MVALLTRVESEAVRFIERERILSTLINFKYQIQILRFRVQILNVHTYSSACETWKLKVNS